MSLKSNLTCSICIKIYQDPISLPCGHTYCREHLMNGDGGGDALFECFPCGKQFNLNEFDDFPANIVVSNQVRDENFLDVDEKKCKIDLKESVDFHKQRVDEFEQTKHEFAKEIDEYFDEIRSQIDLHRREERFKSNRDKIDQIAYAMLDRLKEFKTSYLSCLNVKLDMHMQYAVLAIKHEQKAQIINDLFREPNLTFDEIKQLQVIQDKCINEIKSQQEELTRFREHLKTFRFMPSSLPTNDNADVIALDVDVNRGDDDDFGQLILNEYASSFSDSLILTQQQSFDLVKLCEFSFRHQWKLLYRASRDGFLSKYFHRKCDGHSNTLTIIKSSQNSYIFGGYTEASWEVKRSRSSIRDPQAFLFSLTNGENQPCKMKVNTDWSYMSIDCDCLNGPSFGINDIHISDEPNKSASSYSDLGFAYAHPQYEHKTNEARSFLAGTYKFQVDEIEVYLKDE